MSAETRPITPQSFAAALKDLSLASLHLKVLEIRNSVTHLLYSNEQLRPFAEGTETAVPGPGDAAAAAAAAAGEPDQDCVDAIRENEVVMARMAERIELIRAEVEGRGASWAEFQQKDDGEAGLVAPEPRGVLSAGERPVQNGHREGAEAAGGGGAHPAWSDGTLQTGTIRNGEASVNGTAAGAGAGSGGGSISDDELRRRLGEMMRGLGDDDDEEQRGMHL